MKIKVNEGMDKPFLENGRHLVEITHIDEGTSEHKGVPFFACRFENEHGFVIQRFYNSKAGMPIIAGLFEAADMPLSENATANTEKLIGKKLFITVEERTYEVPESDNERTLKQATGFQKAEQHAAN
jgi:fructose-specific component phosphotransferase system IIB-like protein